MDERYDAEALRLARRAAGPGEAVLWAGRPGQRWRPDADVAVIAGVGVVVYALLWLHFREDWARLWELPGPLAVAALLAILAPWLTKLGVVVWWWRRRAGEVYAVTARRVLILAPDGAVRHAVSLERSDSFRRRGRTLWLDGFDGVLERGKGRLDGGLFLVNEVPRLERLADPERVLAVIRAAA